MKPKALIGVMIVGLFLGASTNVMASSFERDIVVKVEVPKHESMKVAISKVHKEGEKEIWESVDDIVFDEKELEYKPKWHIFLPKHWFVVDIGVEVNTTNNWTLTYSANSIVGPRGYKLDEHVTVVVGKQTKTTFTQIKKCTYGEMLKKTFYKSDIKGGWLRIYYGIATGDKDEDPPNAKPITTEVPAGTYTGSITITLTIP